MEEKLKAFADMDRNSYPEDLIMYLDSGTGTLMIFTVSVPVRFLENLKFRFRFLFGFKKKKL